MQRAGKLDVGTDRIAQLLPLELVHLDRQQLRQRRSAVSARTETFKAAEHDQALAAVDIFAQEFEDRPLAFLFIVRAELRFFFRAEMDLEGGGIDVAEDVDVVLVALEKFGQIAGPRFGAAGIEANGIDFDIARGVERAAEEFLFHAESPLDIKHAQAAFEHLHERRLPVVRGHQLAGLRNGLQHKLVLARLVGHVGEIDRHHGAVDRAP